VFYEFSLTTVQANLITLQLFEMRESDMQSLVAVDFTLQKISTHAVISLKFTPTGGWPKDASDLDSQSIRLACLVSQRLVSLMRESMRKSNVALTRLTLEGRVFEYPAAMKHMSQCAFSTTPDHFDLDRLCAETQSVKWLACEWRMSFDKPKVVVHELSQIFCGLGYRNCPSLDHILQHAKVFL
jgi:hypothetical protein